MLVYKQLRNGKKFLSVIIILSRWIECSDIYLPVILESNSQTELLPRVHIIAIVDSPAYFTEEFFQKLKALDYPQNLLTITIVARYVFK